MNLLLPALYMHIMYWDYLKPPPSGLLLRPREDPTSLWGFSWMHVCLFSFLSYLIYCVCVREGVVLCVRMASMLRLPRGQKINSGELILSFQHGSLWDWIQILRLGAKHFHLLTYLSFQTTHPLFCFILWPTMFNQVACVTVYLLTPFVVWILKYASIFS